MRAVMNVKIPSLLLLPLLVLIHYAVMNFQLLWAAALMGFIFWLMIVLKEWIWQRLETGPTDWVRNAGADSTLNWKAPHPSGPMNHPPQALSKSTARLRAAALMMLVLLITLSKACAADAARKEDPIAGRWRWYDHSIIDLRADGTASAPGSTGTWGCISKATPPTYVITWRDGLYVDTVHLSSSGNALSGTNERGLAIIATRIPNLLPPLIAFAFLTVMLPFMIRYAFDEKWTRYLWQSRINSVFFKPFRPDTSEAAYLRYRSLTRLSVVIFSLVWAAMALYLALAWRKF